MGAKTPSSSTCCRGAWDGLTERHVARAGSPIQSTSTSQIKGFLVRRRVRSHQKSQTGKRLRIASFDRIGCHVRHHAPCHGLGAAINRGAYLRIDHRTALSAFPSCCPRSRSGRAYSGGGGVYDENAAIRHLPLSPEPSPKGSICRTSCPCRGGGASSALSHGASAACASLLAGLAGKAPPSERDGMVSSCCRGSRLTACSPPARRQRAPLSCVAAVSGTEGCRPTKVLKKMLLT